MKLFEIAGEYQALLEQTFDAETGEVNEQALAKLDEIAVDLKEKGIAIASYIKNIEAEETAIDAAIANMEERRNQLAKKTKSLINYLQSNMERCSISQISCPYFAVKLKKCPVSVDILDENAISENYKKVKSVISIDKIKIKEEILAGVIVEGAALKQNMRLEIR